jgi:hypothetical protein
MAEENDRFRVTLEELSKVPLEELGLERMTLGEKFFLVMCHQVKAANANSVKCSLNDLF